MIKVTQLLVYPFKSGKGMSVKQTHFDTEGMLNDRRLMAVNEDGTFITGRRSPEILHLSCTPTVSGWRLAHPNHSDNCDVNASETGISGQIWKDTFDAVDGGDAAAEWISEVLQLKSRIVLWKPSARHSSKYNLDTSFADAAPILMVSEASMRQGCDWAGIPYDARRFRPNIVIDGVEAFAEESWQNLRIGDTEFSMLDTCTRCILTTRDPDTGEAHPDKQPMKALMQKHTDASGQLVMGMNAKVASKIETASISVGDEVIIL